jgi:N-acetyl-beta-hexosaminidase
MAQHIACRKSAGFFYGCQHYLRLIISVTAAAGNIDILCGES